MGATEFRALLEAGDVDGIRAAWAQAAPHLPQMETREAAERAMHHARTISCSVTFKARAYSHAWLTERALPSGLPDGLRPKAERLYPRIASGVGICVKARNPLMAGVVKEVQQAMEYAVLDAEADGLLENSDHVRARMAEARERTYRQLVGRAR